MDHRAVIKLIEQKQFEKIYFLHGEEPYYIDLITEAILANVLEEHERDFNQTVVYGKDVEIPAVIADAKSYPTMSERRLVVIKEAQDIRADQYDKFESYFENPSDQTVFVINYKYKSFDKRKKVMKLAAQNGLVFLSEKVPDYKLTDWITSNCKDKGYPIAPKAAILLGEFLGNNLHNIDNELEKLFLLVQKGTTINDVHIEENIGISKDYNVYELTNAISIRDIHKANVIVNYFSHNPKSTSIIQVISALFNHFSRLMTIHFTENKSRENMASILRVHPFVAGELLKSAKIYNPKKLAANIEILHEYDLKSKGVGNTSNVSEGELMKEMIFKLMH